MHSNRQLEYVVDSDMAEYYGTFKHEKELFSALIKLKNALLKPPLKEIRTVISYRDKKNLSSIRTMTVSRVWYVHSGDAPFIRLQGRWLEKIGFDIGVKLQVIACEGFIMIVPSQNYPPPFMKVVE